MLSHEYAAQSMAEYLREQNLKKPAEKAEGDGRPRQRGRNWSLDNMLTSMRGQKHRPTISKEDISRPILNDNFLVHSPLIPLGQVSQSLPHTPLEPFPAFVARPNPNTPPNKRALPVRSKTDPVQGLSALHFPPLEPEDFHKWLSNPKHLHAYPELGRNRPRPIGYREARTSARKRGHKDRSQSNQDRRKLHHRKISIYVPPHPDRPPPSPPGSVEVPRKRFDSALEDSALESELNRLLEPLVFANSSRFEVNPKKLSRISESSQERSQEIEFSRAQQSTQRLVAAMDRLSLQPPSSVGTKARAIQQAKETEVLVAERAKRSGEEPPPYDFFELIGKGAYGRVFKGKNRATGGLVAIKIIDTDKTDYEEMTTKNLQETLREINILQQLKDSKARPYVNIIEEARTVHNELWIISEYASGGSVNTLMKPRLQLARSGLEEKYIIPIARELALGLKFIHEAGVIHRDIKSNNILILEDGRVQLCDFGVSGALEPEISKRSTIVGTPNWMAPELKKEWVKDVNPNITARPTEILYGSEVDIWAYGCTIYEMATGYPPFHDTKPFLLPEAGVPQLEGDDFSDGLKSLVSFVLEPNPMERPTPDQILEHPYLADTTKMYPTVTLVALVEQYYRWEHAGGSRVSLFNPYGAQAPDPLAPGTEDDDEDWSFSTTEEFERQYGRELADPFTGTAAQDFAGLNAPPQDEDRFAKLQASIRAEQADRGKKRLDRLFDTNTTPYRFSVIDTDAERPSSDLALRDFEPGPPNRETVIDLDFAAPTAADIPTIDLGEVPTMKANRLNRFMHDMDMEEDEDEERDDFDVDQTARRATRDWTFPAMPEQNNRRTVDWKFPAAAPDKSNRRTMEWTFDASMAESTQDPLPKVSRLSRRRDTQELSLDMDPEPAKDNRRTQEFRFPMSDPAEGGHLDTDFKFSSSPTLNSSFDSDDYPVINSAPESPIRSSMIDLDMATINDYRPSTSTSASSATYTAGLDQMNGNPFDLEDQVNLSQTNNRTSYHMKSQSEPNHAIPGLLTPQQYDEQGYPTNQDPHHPSMHARGVSSASQMQSNRPPANIGAPRQRAQLQQQQQQWEGWSHQEAFRIDENSPTSASPITSPEEEDSIDDLWFKLENTRQRRLHPYSNPNFRARHMASVSTDEDIPRSDAEDNYASEQEASAQDSTGSGRENVIHTRVSVGANGRPLVDFPVPRGPDVGALCGVDGDREVLGEALWRGCLEMRDGVRASRDLLKSMRLSETRGDGDDGE